MHPAPYPTRPEPAAAPALYLLHGRWVAACAACGYQLATARTQAQVERRARRRVCPVCHDRP
jgi:hypothetical protein